MISLEYVNYLCNFMKEMYNYGWTYEMLLNMIDFWYKIGAINIESDRELVVYLDLLYGDEL